MTADQAPPGPVTVHTAPGEALTTGNPRDGGGLTVAVALPGQFWTRIAHRSGPEAHIE